MLGRVFARACRGYPPFFGKALFSLAFLLKTALLVKYKDIIAYLYSTVGTCIKDAGLSDERVNKRTEAIMAMDFRRYICGIEGDEGNDFFKADEDDQTYIYNGRYFEVLPEATLLEMIITVMEMSNVGIVYRTGSAKIIKETVLNTLRGSERCKFQPDRRYICFTNGIFDLRQMKLVPFDVKYKTDIVLDFDYVADAKSALWDKVLGQTVPDEGMKETFHQFCGCFLADRKEYKIEYITFVVGEGQNGKSIICRAVINMLGHAIASSYSPEQLFKSSQMEYHLADVNGKIVNYCDEVSNKDFSGGDFKQFVSGGEFTGRHPYSKRPTKVDKIPLMLCCANKIPPTTDDTEGYFRRFLIVLAPNHIDDRDKDPMLEMKLQAPEVKSAIFSWMLEGYKAFVANKGKIEISETIKEVVEEMRDNANSLNRWLSQEGLVAAQTDTKPPAPGWKTWKDWISEYSEFCKSYNEAPRAQSSVSDRFKQMKVQKHRNSAGMWYYLERKPHLEDDDVIEKKVPAKMVVADLPPDNPEDNLPF